MVAGARAREDGFRLLALTVDYGQRHRVELDSAAAIAARLADRHVVVHKDSDGSVTTSDLTVLDAEGREHELSRMFAGMDGSETALAHARELLEAAGQPGR